MSIYEYDAEKHIRQEKEESWEEGRQAGFQELLKQQIQHKLKKGKSAAEIAEDLEQEESLIQNLIKEMEKD